MICFIQHNSQHPQLITKTCSSVSHFTIVSKSCSLQCIFTACIYYFCTIPLRSDIAHPFRKSPTLTLWKSLQIELSQQFPASLSWQNVFIAVQGSSVPMDLCVIQEDDRRVRKHPHVHAPTHIHKHMLCWEAGAQLWAIVTGNGCREVTVPPGRPQLTRCTASMSTDRDRNPMIRQYGKQRYNGNLKAAVKEMLAVFSQQTL